MSTRNTGEARSTPPIPADDEPASEAPSFVAHLLGGSPTDAGAGLGEAVVAAWSDDTGTLADGRIAGLGASCLLRPAPGDRVLAWAGEDGRCWVLAVLQRQSQEAPAVLATGGAMTIEAPRLAMAAKAVHIVAEDFLTSTRNRHAVARTHTETCDVRVSQVGTDIRRATTVDDDIKGTLWQRTGTWISNTARDARLKARTFLFD